MKPKVITKGFYIIIVFATVFSLLCLGERNSVFALVDPGSTNDPLVTLSFVEEKINGYTQKISELESKLADLQSKYKQIEENNKISKSSGTPSIGGQYYKAVKLMHGQTLMGIKGTEFLMYDGSATVKNNSPSGLIDMTEGIGVKAGTEVKQNHTFLITENGTVGVGITSDTAWVMVRGLYYIM